MAGAAKGYAALGKTIGYMLKRRETLSRFLDDDTLPLDNNRGERAIRPVVMTTPTQQPIRQDRRYLNMIGWFAAFTR